MGISDPTHNAKIRGNFRDDQDEVRTEYNLTKIDRSSASGKLTGLTEIDEIIKGARTGQLWIHAAYVGELKSTFALNWAYNQVVRYFSNVFYASLEMPYEDIRRQIGCIHSTHAKWGGRPPLEYESILSGLLTAEEEAFFEEVWADFTSNPAYGDFHCWCPTDDVTIGDIRREAEMVNQESELSVIYIDHGSLVEPEKGKKGKDYTVELNSVLRGAKKLALFFNGGAKIPVVVLFQINREGKDYADKNQGRYKLRHLSYANEAERSADIVTTSYLSDQMRVDGVALFDCLKRRAGPKFNPIQVRAMLASYRLYNMNAFDGVDGGGMTVADHVRTLNLMDAL
jgi:replicative DNA helicase